MARFFGRNKNQAEMDFRRFEQEIYIHSSQRPTSNPSEEEEAYYQEYDAPSFGPRLSTAQPSSTYDNREPQPPLRQERFTPRPSQPQQSQLRPNPELKHSSNLSPQENELYRFAPQQNYRSQDYRQASRQDELKGLGFWQDEEDIPAQESEEWVERPSPFKFIIALLGLTLMMSIVWFGYRWLSRPSSEGPPLLQSEPGPFKVKPENPGGASIPYQDKLIYGRISPEAEAPVERLLPPPEQPEISAANQQGYNQPHGYQPAPQGYQLPSHYPPQAPPNYQGQAAVPYSSHSAPQVPANQQGYYPQNERVYSPYPPSPQSSMETGNPSYPSQPAGGAPSPPQPTNYAPAPLQPTTPYPPYPPSPGEGTPYPAPPYGGQTSYSQPSSPQPVIQEPSLPSPPPSASHKSVVKPSLYIQLGTLPNESGAKQELGRLRKKYYHEIGELEGSVRGFDGQDGKKIFRVLIGPFKTRNTALSKCSKLGSTCRVVQIP